MFFCVFIEIMFYLLWKIRFVKLVEVDLKKIIKKWIKSCKKIIVLKKKFGEK